MGHSRGSLIAALDLSHRDWARRVDVSYDDTPCPLLRLFLVKPFGLALRQTQGGFVTGSYTQRATSDGLVVTHSRGDETWRQPWTIASEDGGVAVTQTDPLRTITHRFLEEGDALELREITVTQFGREHAPMRALFSPALPDLRRPFEGTATSRWVLDINGQQSHAIGLATATWGEVGTKVDLRGSAPWWVADRPMAITVRCDEGSGMASVRVARTD